MTTLKRRRSNSHSDSQNDEAFLKLLSSQRELLQQLNYEGAMRRAGGPPKKRFSIVEGGDFSASGFSVLTNNSISSPGNAMDLLTCSKRMSLGVGSDQFILPTFNELMAETVGVGGCDDNLKGCSITGSAGSGLKGVDKLLDFDCDEPLWVKRQRRRSTLGYLRSIFQDGVDPSQPSLFQSAYTDESRRESMQPLSKYLDSICNSDPLDHDEVMLEPIYELKRTSLPIATTVAISKETVCTSPSTSPSCKFDDSHMKSYMEAFASAMEKSAESQQSIHDWDRKMGLKRSHSKTMRMSTRSRKKLRTIMKKEINAISAR